MDSVRKRQMRRKSMIGTVLFALGIITTIVFAARGSVWLACAGIVLLVLGVIMLYQVGKSLS